MEKMLCVVVLWWRSVCCLWWCRVCVVGLVLFLFLFPVTHPLKPHKPQKKKYEKLGYNTKKGGERDQM